jgi:hypothetical protein
MFVFERASRLRPADGFECYAFDAMNGSPAGARRAAARMREPATPGKTGPKPGQKRFDSTGRIASVQFL